MALPVNIEDLLQGQVVEWERLEFKRGWNPEEVIHTMCAFANDLHNWGGGYIVIGVAEEAGQAVFPPTGIDPKQMDTIQGEVISLANQLQPNYFPRMQPYVKDGQHILACCFSIALLKCFFLEHGSNWSCIRTIVAGRLKSITSKDLCMFN